MESFKLERYYEAREFDLPYHLSDSDCEPVRKENIVRRADEELRRRWHDLMLGYTESQGDPALRELIGMTYREINPNGVLIAAPEECIYIAMRSLLRSGDHVIVTMPAYQSLHAIAKDQGCEITGWFPERQEQKWFFNPAFLSSAARRNTRMLIVNFPHNPTGALPTQSEWAAIVWFARAHGLLLFSDEMYRGLEYHPRDQLPAACDLYENAISLSGMSKAFGMAGLRIGWLATQNRPTLHKAYAEYKDWVSICPPAADQMLALMALSNGECFLHRSRTIIAENLLHARQFFAEERAGLFEWLEPQAGSVCFPRLRGGVPAAHLAADLEAKKQTLLIPGNLFDYPGNHFRIGLGKRGFPEALNRFREYLREHHVA